MPATPTLKADLDDVLLAPDRVLVFCDDTEIAQQPVETLEPDLRILVAVQLRSTDYQPLSETIKARLAANNVNEFHATDIVSGKGVWKGRTLEERHEHFASL